MTNQSNTEITENKTNTYTSKDVGAETDVKPETADNEHHSRSSHHRHHSHHSHSSRTSSKSKRKKSFTEQFKSFIHSLDEKPKDPYLLISRRVLFCLIIVIIFFISIVSIISDDTDPTLTKASYTPSETSQLKSQVFYLQQQVDSLEDELQLYKDKYGELE